MNKKIKFNVLDFAIVLLSVLIVLSVAFWDELSMNFIHEKKSVECSFIATGLTEEMVLAFNKQEKVFFSENGVKFGKIIDFQNEREQLSVTLVDGSSKSYIADTYTIKGKMIVDCVEKENGLYIDGKYFIVSGKKFDVSTSKINMEIEITDVE